MAIQKNALSLIVAKIENIGTKLDKHANIYYLVLSMSDMFDKI